MTSPAITSQGFEDSDIARLSLIEVSAAFEELVFIKRWTGTTGGDDAAGTAATDVFTLIKSHANITALEAREINFPNSIFAIGDLRAEFRVPVFGEETNTGDAQTAGRRSDRVLYRGREYKFVGHVLKTFQNHIWAYEVVLRQVG